MSLEVLSHRGASRPERPALLFVHGGFHGAWCWEEHFLPWYAAQGWDAHAVSLRGHARTDDPEADLSATLRDYGDDVLSIVAVLDRPVVVIGHSMGGVIVQQCLPRSEQIAGAVFLASSPLRPSLSVIARIMAARPLSFLRAQALGDRSARRRAMSSFFFDRSLPQATRDRYMSLLTAESSITELFSREPPLHPIEDKRPVLVVAGKDDWSIPMSEHRRLQRAFRADFAACPGAHDLMLSLHWEATATAINDWLVSRFDI